MLLPDTALDYSAAAEAELLRSGQSGLVIAGRTEHWTFYELPNATPIVTRPRSTSRRDVVVLDAERVWLYFERPGPLPCADPLQPVLAAHRRPGLPRPRPVRDDPGHASRRAGFLRLEIRPGVDQVADAVSKSDGSSC